MAAGGVVAAHDTTRRGRRTWSTRAQQIGGSDTSPEATSASVAGSGESRRETSIVLVLQNEKTWAQGRFPKGIGPVFPSSEVPLGALPHATFVANMT